MVLDMNGTRVRTRTHNNRFHPSAFTLGQTASHSLFMFTAYTSTLPFAYGCYGHIIMELGRQTRFPPIVLPALLATI